MHPPWKKGGGEEFKVRKVQQEGLGRNATSYPALSTNVRESIISWARNLRAEDDLPGRCNEISCK